MLLAVLAVCEPCHAAPTNPATVLFVSGAVTGFTKGGSSELLERGSAWREGVVLRAGSNGRAQIRFSDGTVLSISPGSDVRLDAYRYDGAGGAADLAVFTVYRGSARLMAGTRRTAGSTLRVSTPSAVLTSAAGEFLVETAGSVQVSVGSGQVELRNDGGRLQASAGQRVFVKDRATPPILIGTIVPAPVPPAAR